jgi:hypothetical protein
LDSPREGKARREHEHLVAFYTTASANPDAEQPLADAGVEIL